jgi:tRNA (cmo5U34)-methyltransferase
MPARRRAGSHREPPSRRGWTEADSEAFRAVAEIAVPARRAQVEMLTGLIPAERDEPFTVVELGAGEGLLARAVLRAFPRCRYLALDRSERMRAVLRKTLRTYKARTAVREFELADRAWRKDLPRPLRCVLASLVVHHLSDAEKRRLFVEMARRLDRGGAFLLADLVRPAAARIRRLFAAQWADAARAQSRGRTRGIAALRRFTHDGWNYFATRHPDPYDHPSGLREQLQWLREAGFDRVDCYWMHAGHAIFGGYLLEDRGGDTGEGNQERSTRGGESWRKRATGEAGEAGRKVHRGQSGFGRNARVHRTRRATG